MGKIILEELHIQVDEERILVLGNSFLQLSFVLIVDRIVDCHVGRAPLGLLGKERHLLRPLKGLLPHHLELHGQLGDLPSRAHPAEDLNHLSFLGSHFIEVLLGGTIATLIGA